MVTDKTRYRDFKMPACKCLACGYTLDAATATNGGRRPRPGDVTICMKCGHIMGFRKNLTVRPLTTSEILAVAGNSDVIAIQKARIAALPADFILNWPPKPNA